MIIIVKAILIKMKPLRSFLEKNGWNCIFSPDEEIPKGLFDPVW